MGWKKGETGNKGGRPRSGKSLAEAIRRRFDPEKMADKLGDIMDNAPSEQTRLRAAEMILTWGFQKPATSIEVGPPSEFEDVSDDELVAMRERARARLEVVEGRMLGEGASTGDAGPLEHDVGLGDAVEVAAATSGEAEALIAVTTLRPGVLVRRPNAGHGDTNT